MPHRVMARKGAVSLFYRWSATDGPNGYVQNIDAIAVRDARMSDPRSKEKRIPP